jgi:hypothetical protein
VILRVALDPASEGLHEIACPVGRFHACRTLAWHSPGSRRAAQAFAYAGNPTGNLFRTLETFGAGRLLGLWLNDPNHGCSQGQAAAYALIGVSGAPTACEELVEIHPSVNRPGDGVTINAYMQPQRDGTFMPVC